MEFCVADSMAWRSAPPDVVASPTTVVVSSAVRRRGRGRDLRAARKLALSEGAHHSPLAQRPYDLRHAAVSMWLTGGVEPARVAEWAGHSVSVLYEVYGAFLDGGDGRARKQVQAALGHLD